MEIINLKMAKRPKQTLIQRGHREGQEIHEKYAVTGHQRDAN